MQSVYTISGDVIADGHAEEGAVGGSLSVDEEENPAHRHFSSKKQRLMRDLQEEEEEEVMGAAALPGIMIKDKNYLGTILLFRIRVSDFYSTHINQLSYSYN